MRRQFRLSRSTDFKRVRRFGKSYAHPLLVLVVLPSSYAGLRFGVTAGKSVGGAVERNRAKRLLRAAVQPLLPEIHTGWEAILIARPALLEAGFPSVQRALVDVLSRARLIENSYAGR